MRPNTTFVERELDAVRTVVVTGACRSGKTLYGNIIATARHVEYADEPWTAMMLPMIVGAHHVTRAFGSAWLRNLVGETYNDLALLRSANFRPTDLSSVWTKKTPAEIFQRLFEVQSRSDVAAMARLDSPTLVLTLAECGSFADIIQESLPSATIVHVVRNGFDVAHDVAAKSWFSDNQLRQPANAQLYSEFIQNGETLFLPWWIDVGDEAFFLSLDDYERGLYYWCALMEQTDESATQVRVVRFDDLIRHPARTMSDEFDALGLLAGPLTANEIGKVAPTPPHTRRPVASTLGERAAAICERHNLP